MVSESLMCTCKSSFKEIFMTGSLEVSNLELHLQIPCYVCASLIFYMSCMSQIPCNFRLHEKSHIIHVHIMHIMYQSTFFHTLLVLFCSMKKATSHNYTSCIEYTRVLCFIHTLYLPAPWKKPHHTPTYHVYNTPKYFVLSTPCTCQPHERGHRHLGRSTLRWSLLPRRCSPSVRIHGPLLNTWRITVRKTTQRVISCHVMYHGPWFSTNSGGSLQI